MIQPRPFEYPASGKVRRDVIYRNEASDTARSVVVVVHGLLAHRDLPEIRTVCTGLAAAFDVVAVNLRGHGDAPGRFTWGREEQTELADLIAFLHMLYPRVGVLAFSIGGFIAIISAARSRNREDAALPDALCTVGAPSSLEPWRLRFRPMPFLAHLNIVLGRRGRFVRPGWPRLTWDSAVRRVGAVSPVPLLVMHGGKDWLVNPVHARRLYEAAAPPKELHLIDRGLHAEYIVTQDPALVLDPARAFFSRALVSSGR